MSTLVTTGNVRLMLDTDVISDLMRNPQGRCNVRLQEHVASSSHRSLKVSVITDCEIHFGLENRPSKLLAGAYADLLRVVEVVSLDASVTHHYARTRAYLAKRGTPIGPNDTLIAAHALALDCTLITGNAAEFARVPGLRVENWLR